MKLTGFRVALLALAALALLALPVLRSIESLALDSSADVILAGDERNAASYARLDELVEQKTLVAVVATGPAWFSDAGAALLYELGQALDALPGTDDVKSLTHSWRPVREGFSLNIEEMIGYRRFIPIDHRGDAVWQRISEQTLAHPLAKDLFISADGRWTLTMAVVDRALPDHAAKAALRDEVLASVAPLRDRAELHVFAFPFVEADMRETVGHDLRRFLAAVAVLVVAILALTFRSLPTLLVVLVSEAVGLALLPVLFHVNGATVNLYTGMLFPLAAGLQLTFLVHFCSALRGPLARGAPASDACAAALGVVLLPSLVAAATTALGLAALVTCDVGLVREFGLLGAQAAGLVFVVSFVPPLVVARGRWRGTGQPAAPGDPGARVATALLAGPLRRPGLVLVAAIAVIALCVPGIARIRTDIRALEFLEPQSEARHVLGVLDAHLGGINTYELVVDSGRPGGAHDLALLAFVEELRVHAETRPGVTNAYAYSQLFRLLNQLWYQDAPGSDRLPDSPLVLQGYAAALAASPFPLRDRFTDGESRTATVVLRTRDMPARAYLAVLEDVLEWGREHAPEGVTVLPREGLHTLLRADRAIVSSQVTSVATGMVAILLALGLLWRAPRLALAVVLSNVLPLACVLALLGVIGLPLNSITVMVGAAALGIAVDDGIHFVAAYRAARVGGRTAHHALADALAAKLVPITCTTAILASALGLFALTSFPPVAQFGLLTALALLLAWGTVLLVLPALVLRLTRERPDRSST